jgi:hypothetical protein
MMKFAASALFILMLCFVPALGQSDTKWEQIRSNDSRMAFMMPVTLRHFYDAEGFIIGALSGDVVASDFHVINAYDDEAIISVESFRASEAGTVQIYELEKQRKTVTGSSKSKVNGVTIRELTIGADNFTGIRQYFHLNGYNYIITAASRKPGSQFTKRFLDSIKFAGKDEKVTFTGVPLEKVIRHPVDLEIADEDTTKTAVTTSGPKKDEPGVVKMALVHAPNPSFTGVARTKGTQGRIRLRVVLAADGLPSKVTIQKSLDNGLLRQAVFCAIRTKYLPKLKDGRPIDSTNPIEYFFGIR